MIKTLLEYISESDDEFELEILSCRDIHKMMDEVNRALLRYDLRTIEKSGVSPMGDSEDFSWCGLTRVYKVKAMVGFIPRGGLKAIADQISLECNLPQNHVVVKSDDVEEETTEDEISDELDPVLLTPPGEHPLDRMIDDAQDLVGQKRVMDYLEELSTARKKIQDSKDKKLKKILATHIAVKEIIGESLPKGYYECLVTEGKGLKVLGRADRRWRKAIGSKEEFAKHLRSLSNI